MHRSQPVDRADRRTYCRTLTFPRSMTGMIDSKLAMIGTGQMARALAAGFVRAGLVSPENVWAADPQAAALEALQHEVAGIQPAVDNAAAVAAAAVVFPAVKPQHVPAVIAEIAEHISPEKLVVSIAAGVTTETLCRRLGSSRVIRVMPNTPCLVGRSASAFCRAQGASEADAVLVKRLLEAVGIAFELDESLLDAVTGLSGSGPAFVYTVIEALGDGGVKMGLPRTVATALAAQTVSGAAEMVLQSGEHTGVLRDRVASPGGTTIAGLAELEAAGLRAALIAAVEAATLRSAELGRTDTHS